MKCLCILTKGDVHKELTEKKTNDKIMTQIDFL